ncbi:MAG TPA: hypothetical protein VL588_12365 [Bdellovibrionota bacterium]|nr:hypothetical protein [Bdellovibrionota bacterium]
MGSPGWIAPLLKTLAVAFGVLFALPLFLMPLRWARTYGWTVPDGGRERDLVVYLGRCLGAAGLAIGAGAWMAAANPAGNLVLIDLLIVAGGLLTLIHIWGAIRREQPWIETAEIALYAIVTAALLGARFAL